MDPGLTPVEAVVTCSRRDGWGPRPDVEGRVEYRSPDDVPPPPDSRVGDFWMAEADDSESSSWWRRQLGMD